LFWFLFVLFVHDFGLGVDDDVSVTAAYVTPLAAVRVTQLLSRTARIAGAALLVFVFLAVQLFSYHSPTVDLRVVHALPTSKVEI
jgi:hypothetical protein